MSKLNKCAVCSKLCDLSCGHCRKVWYCSAEHQKSHRKEHKAECFPAIEKENAETGPFLVATRNIKPLEIIWTEKPLTFAPCGYLSTLQPMCLACCKVLEGKFALGKNVCPVCCWPLCNPVCALNFWHSQYECKLFAEKFVDPSEYDNPHIYLCIHVLRIILMRKKDPVKWKKITSLKSHYGFRTKDAIHTHVLDFASHFIRNICFVIEKPDVIEQIFGILKTHSFSAFHTTESSTESLVGQICFTQIYERDCKLSHNCRPNTMVINYKTEYKQKVLATREIKTGESLSTIYRFDVPTMNFPGSYERRQVLLKQYSLRCKCIMCSDPTELGSFYSAIKCFEDIDDDTPCPGYFLPVDIKKDPEPLMKEKWRCNFEGCRKTKKYSFLNDILDVIRAEVSACTTLLEKLELLQRHENITLHENHFLLTKVRVDCLLPLYNRIWKNSKEELQHECTVMSKELKSMALKCLSVADKFHPELSVLRATLIFYVVAGNCLEDNYINRHVNPNDPELEKIFKLRDEALRILVLWPQEAYERYLYNTLSKI